MVRKKIKIKRIENASARQVTFSKRRRGLLKKAHDLAVLCDAEVGVIIFSNKGKLFHFANPSMQSVLERYINSCTDGEAANINTSTESGEIDGLSGYTQLLQALQRNVIGDGLKDLSLRDLIHLEQQINESLGYIQARKGELLVDEVDDMKQKMAEIRKAASVNSSILNKLVGCCSMDMTDPGNSSGQVERETCPNMVVAGEHSDNMAACLHDAAKRSEQVRDLNRSPTPYDSSIDKTSNGF